MNINSAFPSKYLKADVDVTDDLIVKIKSIKIEGVGQGDKTEQKPVVYFDGLAKGLVLNKTNANAIASLAKSDDTDDWKGVQVRLISTEVEYQGKIMPGIRVRPVKKPTTRTIAEEDNTPDFPPPTDDDLGI